MPYLVTCMGSTAVTTMAKTISETLEQIVTVCDPSPADLDALGAKRSPLILDLRGRRDRRLGEIQPGYIWLRPMDDDELMPGRAMIHFVVKAIAIWDLGKSSGHVVFLANDEEYAKRVVVAVQDAVSRGGTA